MAAAKDRTDRIAVQVDRDRSGGAGFALPETFFRKVTAFRRVATSCDKTRSAFLPHSGIKNNSLEYIIHAVLFNST
jgi:hypothetical protein